MRTQWARSHGPLLALIAEGFCSRLSFGVISYALPLYAHHLGLGLAEIGLLASLSTAVALAAKPAMGSVADRAGLKRGLTVAVVLRSAVALLLALATAPWQLWTIRAVYGVSQSLRDPSADALIAVHGDKKAIASAFAWYATAKKVAGSLGAAVAGVVLTLTGRNFSIPFVLAFVLSFMPLYVVLRYVGEHGRGGDPERKRLPAVSARHPVRAYAQAVPLVGARPALPAYVGLGLLISGTAQMLRGLLPILATEYAGLSDAQTGVAYLVSSVVVLGSGPLFGWLADHVSQPLVLAVRSVANTVSSTIFLVAPNPPGFVVGLVVDDVGKSAYRPAWGALMARVGSFDPRRRAQTMSWMSWGEDVGEVGGPILTGFVWGTWGIAAVMGLRILLALGTEIYATVLMRGLERRNVPAVIDESVRASETRRTGAAGAMRGRARLPRRSLTPRRGGSPPGSRPEPDGHTVPSGGRAAGP